MMELIGNHIWQSTLFAATAALLTLFFRKNHARIRYGLWLAASIKFLIPFSLFIAIGSSIDVGWRQSPAVPQTTISYVEEISQPFGPTGVSSTIPAAAKPERIHWFQIISAALWASGFMTVLCFYLTRGWRLRATGRKTKWLTEGRAYDALRALDSRSGCRMRIKLAVSPSPTEPGVFGIFRPMLFLPEGMMERLNDLELEGIIAHEVAHVRRHDNLTAAIHMVIEAFFWFHPMIWWVGAKLVQERENACDEEVLKLGKNPQAYAEGILKVCEFYLESPLTCVAGVTGADMKKRVQAIMTHRIGDSLNVAKKLALTMVGIIALAFPVILGLFKAPSGLAQSQIPVSTASRSPIEAGAGPTVQGGTAPKVPGISRNDRAIPEVTSPKPAFEVVSIKTAENCGNTAPGIRMKIPGGTRYEPGGHYISCNQLIWIIMDAYQLDPSLKPTGGSGWVEDTLFQIEAKAEGNPSKDEMRLMVQSLLEQRFKLKMHHESRKGSVYLLTVAEGGPKLQPAKDAQGNPVTSLPSDEERQKKWEEMTTAKLYRGLLLPGSYAIAMKQGDHELIGRAMSTGKLTDALFNAVGNRKIVDKTGLTGLYDINLVYANPFRQQGISSAADPAPAAEPSAPLIFTAIQEQLGLRLVPDEVPLQFPVIDRVEKPSEN